MPSRNWASPMIRFSSERDWGLLDLFVLPGFRERTFPGIHGRFRSQPRVDRDLTRYESDKEDRHIDLAIRWAHSLGDWDIGLAHFHGHQPHPRPGPREQYRWRNCARPLLPADRPD